jgi:hypothetical protein
MHCEQDYLLEIVGQTESDVFLTQRLFQCYLLQFLPMAASSSGTSWPTAPGTTSGAIKLVQPPAAVMSQAPVAESSVALPPEQGRGLP